MSRILYIAKTKSLFTPISLGLLYNFYATIDLRNICNTGFYIPTRTELNTLSTYLGGSTVAGGKLKETGTTNWNTPNAGATNDVLFNARAAGQRTHLGVFQTLGGNMFLNCTTQLDATYSWVLSLYSNSTNFSEALYQKGYGNSLRAMRSATTPELSLPDGLIADTYTGNDGKIYRCCKIGTQIWTADNLAETKFANGDWITGFDGGTCTPISNTNWAAKTTEACCCYNDDTSNI